MAKHTKTVANWEAEGWTRLDLGSGQGVAIAFDHETQEIEINRGHVFGADGSRLKGRARPKFTIVETDAGCQIVASAAATVLYTLVDAQPVDDEDEAPEEPEPEEAA